ncbi:hypothetical protein FB45DRAFT_397266 [Roridomyces roridus]|uniref:TERF2-interacting telomeric protein 1 Myb domain-containing protein n=1 Tax=Roridomyces roridus TaxID=1738132 RepID=A0AAD7C3G5_9AGAR|nr:hypothetical protein FB45DRAFT_397266 [Roridomyces roridus]
MTGRNAFSTDDDKFLVKYIATYNPGVPGRSGNNLYKRLTENADRKWSWSERHTWQSWRERYTKNASYFNERIEKYQKKHGMPMENAGHINGTKAIIKTEDDSEEERIPAPTRKRKRKSDENARKRLRREEESGGSDQEPQRSKRQPLRKNSPSPPPPEAHPEIVTLDAPESSDSVTESDSDNNAPPPRRPKSKAAVILSSSVAPSPNANGTVEKPKSKPHPNGRPLPKIVQGLLRNDFARPRRMRDDTDDEEENGEEKQWPPERPAKTRSKVSKPKPKPSSADEMDELEEEAVVSLGAEPNLQELEHVDAIEQDPRISLPPPAPPRSPAAIKRSPLSPRPHRSAPPPQHVNAVASSSRVRLTPAPAPLPSPVRSTLTAGSAQRHGPSVQKSASVEWLARLRQREKEVEPRQSSSMSPIDWGSPVKRRMSPPPNGGIEMARNISMPRNNSPMRSVTGSTENGSHRRSQAPSPGSVRHLDLGRNSLQSLPTPVEPRGPDYSLPSPPRGASSQGLLRRHLDFRSGTESYEATPLAGKAKGKSKALPRDRSTAPATADTHTRRHSLPAPLARQAQLAGVLPRIDFQAGKISFTAPLKTSPGRAVSVSSLFKRRVSGSGLKEELTRRSLPAPARERLPTAPPPLDEEQLARKYNQPVEVVREVIEATGEGAEMVLRRMKEGAERARREALEEMGVRVRNEEESVVLRHKRPRESGDDAEGSGQRNRRDSSRQVEVPDTLLHSRGREREREISNAGRADQRHVAREEGPFVFHHRRRDSAPHRISRTSAAAEEEEFRPQPLARDVFADIGYSPPSRSRARVAQKQLGLGRGRVSSERSPQVQPTTPATSRRASEEEEKPQLPRFEEVASDVRVLREIETVDLSAGLRIARDVAAYMCSGDLPSPSR